MRKQEALKLHNRDEVRVRGADNKWSHGYVLGSPKERQGRVLVPVVTKEDGFREVDHTDVR